MRLVLSTSMILLGQLALGSALAEPMREPRITPRSSKPLAGAEERLRAATSSICRGCDGEPQTRERTQRKRQAIAPGRRSRQRVTGTWVEYPRLPLTSRAEAQTREISRVMAGQQQQRRFEQQVQFEINQLRYELSQGYLFR